MNTNKILSILCISASILAAGHACSLDDDMTLMRSTGKHSYNPPKPEGGGEEAPREVVIAAQVSPHVGNYINIETKEVSKSAPKSGWHICLQGSCATTILSNTEGKIHTKLRLFDKHYGEITTETLISNYGDPSTKEGRDSLLEAARNKVKAQDYTTENTDLDDFKEDGYFKITIKNNCTFLLLVMDEKNEKIERVHKFTIEDLINKTAGASDPMVATIRALEIYRAKP